MCETFLDVHNTWVRRHEKCTNVYKKNAKNVWKRHKKGVTRLIYIKTAEYAGGDDKSQKTYILLIVKELVWSETHWMGTWMPLSKRLGVFIPCSLATKNILSALQFASTSHINAWSCEYRSGTSLGIAEAKNSVCWRLFEGSMRRVTSNSFDPNTRTRDRGKDQSSTLTSHLRDFINVQCFEPCCYLQHWKIFEQIVCMRNVRKQQLGLWELAFFERMFTTNDPIT